MSQSALADRLFQAFATTLDRESFRRICEEDRALWASLPMDRILANVDHIATWSASQLKDELSTLTATEHRHLGPFYLAWFLYLHQDRMTMTDLRFLEDPLLRTYGPGGLELRLLKAHIADATLRSGDSAAALRVLEDCHPETSPAVRTSSQTVYVNATIEFVIGKCCRLGGNYQMAHRHLKRAMAWVGGSGMLAEWTISQQLATLHWASGQHREALRLHSDPARRSAARNAGKIDFLAVSHLSAAKCAIDWKATATAVEELREAKQLLTEHPEIRPVLHGHALLYSGELEVQKENYDRGIELLEAAEKHFESMDPPYHPGALDAKIALGHFALYMKDHRTAVLIIQKLLAEAEEKGCLEARARLLALETYLYVTEEPPLREAYKDLVTRIHLINNPALLMRALGNLYTYALEFLDEREQAFLLMRIQNLRHLLEESCFDDLYRSCVTDRYAGAIENRLARFVDKDWEGWEAWEEPGGPSGLDGRAAGEEEPPAEPAP